MDCDDPADRIRQRMTELRRELSYDVKDVGRSARAMADWTLYVRRFPWASVAIAIAAGYLLVPRKKQIIYPGAAALAKLVKQNQVRVQTDAGEQSPKGMLKSLLVMGVMSAARMGMNVMVKRLTSTMNPAVHPTEATPASHESWEM